MQNDPRHYTPRAAGKLFILGWVAAVVIIFIVAGALVWARDTRVRRQTAQLEEAQAQGRRVLVTHPTHSPPSRSLDIPATIHGFVETPIYAKIAGYLKTIAVDKGDRVTANQLLAVLDSPEIDQQVVNARANYNLQVLTDRRNGELAERALIARQTADEAHAAMLQAKANLEQLVAMQAYKEIRAPFAGMVTARYVDPGALIPQATGSTAGTPIITLATLSPVRVYADVPQSAAPFIQNGDPATVSVTQYPDRQFQGNVTRHPDALQPATRTMLVEVDVPNADFALLPGMYASVTFKIAVPAGPPQVPDDALVFRDGKVYVPVVRQNRLDLAEVRLGYDNGRTVEITSGIAPDDQVAVNVGQAVRSGEVVQPIPAATD